MSAKVEVELQPFQVPNFAIMVTKPRPREEGFVESPKFALQDLSAEALETLCDQFRKDVFTKAGKRDPEFDRPKAG